MDRCPVCRARLRERDECRRCGADFTLARRAEEAAFRLFTQSLQLYQQGERTAALEAVSHALLLKSDPVFRGWNAFLHAVRD